MAYDTYEQFGGADLVPAAEESRTAQARYNELVAVRENFRLRARRSAQLTISSLYREWGANDTTETAEPWQSFGAACVKSLVSKLILTLFPPGVCPIRLDPSKATIDDLAKLVADPTKLANLKIQIGKGLRQAESEFTTAITEDLDSAVFAKGLLYMVVGGDHGFQMYPNGTWRGIPLERYTVLRDAQGNLLEFVIDDPLMWDTLPKATQDYLRQHRPTEMDSQGNRRLAHRVDVFTHGRFQDGQYHVYQESLGYRIPDTDRSWNKDYLPFIFAPWNLLPGEDYGRSYVEDFTADFQTLDGAEEIIQESTAAAGLLIRTVKPGGVTSKEALAKARNGAVITGDLNDIGTVETGKGADLQVIAERINDIKAGLSQAFLRNSAVQRDAERVTAEEIRQVTQELNEQLGSLYLELIGTIQKPWARLKLAACMRNKRMTPLPPKQVQVQIATGAAALARNAQVAILDALTMPASPAMQEQAAKYIDAGVFFRQRAIALGADQDGLVKTDDQLADEAAQAQQAEMMQNTAPNMVKAAGDIIGKGVDHGAALQQNAQQAALANSGNSNSTQGS